MSGILYVVGTPIGNLSDFSPRAQEILSEVDFIAAEDTRVTLKLLNHFDIKKPMVSYFEHNKYQRGEMICQRIEAGENCALVSDAGMPANFRPQEKCWWLSAQSVTFLFWLYQGQAPWYRHWQLVGFPQGALLLKAF